MVDENGWLKAFLETTVVGKDSPKGLTCDQMNEIFFTSSGTCIDNRMAHIFGALANENHPDFVVMSEFLNSNAKVAVS